MTFSRRELFRRALVLGLPSAHAAALVACADDEDGPRPPGADSGSDTGSDAGDDTSPDVDPDTDPEPTLCDDTLPEYAHDGPVAPEDTFAHGVASGDPLPDAVILWTRVTVDREGPVEVWYEIATDPEFTCRVDAGWAQTDAELDHTVKIDVGGLAPGSAYWYRFFFEGRASVVGRTRTAPEGDVDRLRFAVCSCSSLGHGYFHAYRGIAERNDISAVLHLGDYIYEYGTNQYGTVRPYEPSHEILTLEDYRTRYAQYRRDADLQEVHRQHPFIAIWDDHETADNSWPGGAGNHDPATEGPWEDRKAAAIRAYKEWMPLRETEYGRVWRSFRYGNLLDLIMLDTRLWGRDEEAGRNDTDAHADPTRQLLGEDQEDWLREQLGESTARWKVLGQQVMVGTYRLSQWTNDEGGGIFNPDQWDGYRGARKRLFEMIEETDPGSVVVLTGDIHSSWAFDLAYDPNDPTSYDPDTQEGSIAVEFVTPAISSPGFPRRAAAGAARQAQLSNPTLRWAELANRGYIVLDIDAERVESAWYHYEDVISPDPATYPEAFEAAWATLWGSGRLTRHQQPASPIVDAPPPAP